MLTWTIKFKLYGQIFLKIPQKVIICFDLILKQNKCEHFSPKFNLNYLESNQL